MNGTTDDKAENVPGACGTTTDNGTINGSVTFADAGGTGGIQTITSYGTAPAGDGLWHHIVATSQNGETAQLFVNGVLEATSTGTPAIAASGGHNNVLCIGCNPDNGREFDGLMDDVAMWDRVLTGAEIYEAGKLENDLFTLLPLPGDDDGDGLPDAWEIRYGLDPNDNGDVDPANGALGDPDMDGLIDGDLFSDSDEMAGGSDPNDVNSTPVVPELPELLLYYSFDVEDGMNITAPALNVIISGHGRDAGDDPGNGFSGWLDEVKIYGTALTEAQVREAMVPGSGGAGGLAITATGFDPNIGANGQFRITFNSRRTQVTDLSTQPISPIGSKRPSGPSA